MDDDNTYDSDNSLDDINAYEKKEVGPSKEEEDHIDSVREAVKRWKRRELDKSAGQKENPDSFNGLNNFLRATARLLYDIQEYISSAQNKEENMKDHLYVKIIQAIGNPFTLSSFERINIEDVLNTDLVELPYTVDPDLIDEFKEKKIKANTKIYNKPQ